ncbi:MAG: hypothetical protein ACQESG_07430, partial [Nanobdellota archaeon]
NKYSQMESPQARFANTQPTENSIRVEEAPELENEVTPQIPRVTQEKPDLNRQIIGNLPDDTQPKTIEDQPTCMEGKPDAQEPRILTQPEKTQAESELDEAIPGQEEHPGDVTEAALGEAHTQEVAWESPDNQQAKNQLNEMGAITEEQHDTSEIGRLEESAINTYPFTGGGTEAFHTTKTDSSPSNTVNPEHHGLDVAPIDPANMEHAASDSLQGGLPQGGSETQKNPRINLIDGRFTLNDDAKSLIRDWFDNPDELIGFLNQNIGLIPFKKLEESLSESWDPGQSAELVNKIREWMR